MLGSMSMNMGLRYTLFSDLESGLLNMLGITTMSVDMRNNLFSYLESDLLDMLGTMSTSVDMRSSKQRLRYSMCCVSACLPEDCLRVSLSTYITKLQGINKFILNKNAFQ